MSRHGWSVSPDWLDSADAERLRQECEVACEEGLFRRAGVGRGKDLAVREDIRRDQVLWIDPATTSVEQQAYLARLEVLRLELNQRLFLGLFDFEGHFAIYPDGAFYKPHLDRHAGTQDRIVTAILYLNPDWKPGDGGELKIWTSDQGREGPFELIEPRLGTLVCFLAGEFWHEVLPTRTSRMSITGWFRQR